MPLLPIALWAFLWPCALSGTLCVIQYRHGMSGYDQGIKASRVVIANPFATADDLRRGLVLCANHCVGELNFKRKT